VHADVFGALPGAPHLHPPLDAAARAVELRAPDVVLEDAFRERLQRAPRRI
jgi:hypothetical protein